MQSRPNCTRSPSEMSRCGDHRDTDQGMRTNPRLRTHGARIRKNARALSALAHCRNRFPKGPTCNRTFPFMGFSRRCCRDEQAVSAWGAWLRQNRLQMISQPNGRQQDRIHRTLAIPCREKRTSCHVDFSNHAPSKKPAVRGATGDILYASFSDVMAWIVGNQPPCFGGQPNDHRARAVVLH